MKRERQENHDHDERVYVHLKCDLDQSIPPFGGGPGKLQYQCSTRGTGSLSKGCRFPGFSIDKIRCRECARGSEAVTRKVAEAGEAHAVQGPGFMTGQNLVIDGGMTKKMIYLEET